MPFIQHLFLGWLQHSPDKLKVSLQQDSYAFSAHLKSPRGEESIRCLQDVLSHGCFLHGGTGLRDALGNAIRSSLPVSRHQNPQWVFYGKQELSSMCIMSTDHLSPNHHHSGHSKVPDGFSLPSSSLVFSSVTATCLDVAPTLPRPERRSLPEEQVHMPRVLSFTGRSSLLLLLRLLILFTQQIFIASF